MVNIEKEVCSYIIYKTDLALDELRNTLIPSVLDSSEFTVLIDLLNKYADPHVCKSDNNLIKKFMKCVNTYINNKSGVRSASNFETHLLFCVEL